MIDAFYELNTGQLYALRDSIKDEPLLEKLAKDVSDTISSRRKGTEDWLEKAKLAVAEAEAELATFPDEEKRKWENLATAPKNITLRDNAGDLIAWNDLSAKWQFFDKARDSWVNLYGSEQVLSEELAPFTEA